MEELEQNRKRIGQCEHTVTGPWFLVPDPFLGGEGGDEREGMWVPLVSGPRFSHGGGGRGGGIGDPCPRTRIEYTIALARTRTRPKPPHRQDMPPTGCRTGGTQEDFLVFDVFLNLRHE